MIGLLQLDPANRLTGEQALRHAYFDDIREPEVEEELSSLIAPVQRPIYSSQSRITSYGQKFGNTYLQSQLIQPGIGLTNQRQNGSTCKERTPAPSKHHGGPQSTSSGNNGSAISGNNGQVMIAGNPSTLKMHMTGMESFNVTSKRGGPQAIPLSTGPSSNPGDTSSQVLTDSRTISTNKSNM